MNFVRRVLIPTSALLLVAASVGQARVWTDMTGKHRFEAELVSVNATFDDAIFIGKDGKEYEFPIEGLSLKDQKYLFKLTAKLRRRPAKKLTVDDIPHEVLYRMKQAAIDMWPDDEDSQAEEMAAATDQYLQEAQQKVGGTRSVSRSGSVEEIVRQRAAEKWPDDAGAQQEYTKRQLAFYRLVRKYETKKLPALVIVQIKHNARKVSPSDYQEQLVYIHNQVKAGVDYVAKLKADEKAAKIAKSSKSGSSTPKATETREIAVTSPSNSNELGSLLLSTTASPSAAIMPQVAQTVSVMGLPAATIATTTSQVRCVPAAVVSSSRRSAKRSNGSSWKWFARTQSKR